MSKQKSLILLKMLMGILNFAVQAVRLGIFMLFLLMAAWQDFKTKEINVRLFLIFGVGWSGSLACLSGSGNGGRCTGIGAEPKAAARSSGRMYLQSFLLGQLARAGAVSFFQSTEKNFW